MKAYPEIRRRIRDVGLIRVSARTHDAGLLRRMRDAVEDLRTQGRLDWLAALRDGKITPLAMLERLRGTPIKELPPAEVPLFTEATIRTTVDRLTVSERHRRDLRHDLRRLLGRATTGVTLQVLPDLVLELREAYAGRKQFRAFNKLRASALTLLRETVRRRSPIYQDVLDIAVLPTRRKREGNPLTPLEAFTIAAGMGEWGKVWLAMCLTGMGPAELWGAWDLLEDRVLVHGTKREGRERIVFKLADLERPPLTYDAGYKRLRAGLETASKGAAVPYDARRTFAHWCEEAGVPRSRIDLYLGHGPRSMLDLYTRHDVAKYLAHDGEAVRRLLAEKLARTAIAKIGDSLGAPPWNRTKNLLIKSPLLQRKGKARKRPTRRSRPDARRGKARKRTEAHARAPRKLPA